MGYKLQILFLSLTINIKVKLHDLPHLPHSVEVQHQTVRPHNSAPNIFIAFLDELGKSKPFETYLFFGSFWSEKCGPHSTALCGQVRTAQCGQI